MNARNRASNGSAESDRLVQIISFAIGAEQFGVEIRDVQEVITMSTITEIPNSPDFLEGLINVRGNIIPVLDLRKRLRMPGARPAGESAPGARILVVEIEGKVTAFIVDSLAKLLSAPAAQISPPPSAAVAGVQGQYIDGVIHLDEGILVLLDFRKILSIEEKMTPGTVSPMVPTASESAPR